jgi:hypothetical protein
MRAALRRSSSIFDGRAGYSDYLIVKKLALSPGPLTKAEIHRRVMNLGFESTQIPHTTSDDRVDSLAASKPFLKQVGTKPSRRGSRFPAYDLTLRGWMAGLIVIGSGNEAELRQFALRAGRCAESDVLRVIGFLAREVRFWPLVKEFLLYCRRGLVQERPDFAVDSVLTTVLLGMLRKNLRVVLRSGEFHSLAVEANSWLREMGQPRFEEIPTVYL